MNSQMAESRKPIPEKEDIVDKNVHFYVVAILLSIAKLSYSWMSLEDYNLLKIDQPTVIFLVEIVSIPLSVVNPSAWFSIFMTSLAILCVSTGYPSFAIATILLMFGTLYGSEYIKCRSEERRNYRIFHVEAKPLIDEKVLAAAMV